MSIQKIDSINNILKTPGDYNYCGFTIEVKRGKRVNVTDNRTGSLVIVDEIIETDETLDYILNTINNAR